MVFTMPSRIAPAVAAQYRSDIAPVIHPVSRAAFYITGSDAFRQAIREAVVWMSKRNGEIPPSALDGEPFKVGTGAQYAAEAVDLDQGDARLWAAMLEDRREQAALGRIWLTEITIRQNGPSTAFGARLTQTVRGAQAPFQASRPGCVRQVLSRLSAVADGQSLSDEPRAIESDDDIAAFHALLLDRQRRLPVVAVSETDFGTYGIDPWALSQRISGLAHIVVLSPEASWQTTRHIGKANSTFRGATRLYRPGFDPAEGNPYDHPLWLIRAGDRVERAAIIDQISSWVTASSIRAPASTVDFPRYEEVRRSLAQRIVVERKTAGAVEGELASLFEEENTKLREEMIAQKAEHDASLQLASDELMRAEAMRDEALAERADLLARVGQLERALRERQQAPSDEPLTRFDEIENWSRRHLAGSVWIAKKAIRESEKNGQFEDVELFGRTLLMLRDVLVPMRRSPGAERKRAFETALRELGVEDEACFGQRGSIKAFPEYKVSYGGADFWCERHIKRGGGTDPRKLFRIYYHWHEQDGMLLIGHMPTHLDNKQTN